MEERTFALFNDLSDEICIHILSYVSTAPFEAIDDGKYFSYCIIREREKSNF